jgi:hypothetical protein
MLNLSINTFKNYGNALLFLDPDLLKIQDLLV